MEQEGQEIKQEVQHNQQAEPSQNLLIPGSILAAGVIVALAIVYTFGGAQSAKPMNQETDDPVDLADDDAFRGNPSAPVTMVEFSDYQCPFCRKYWRQIMPRLEEDYIKTGKVRFVYRDFPLSSHPAAESAAHAAECAADQNKYWEMHDKIFQEQDLKAVRSDKMDTVSFTDADLERWASQIGLNTEDFNECFRSRKHTEEIAKDFSDGREAGVQGTPGTFVNGAYVNGAVSYEDMKRVIDAELAKVGR